MAIAGGGADGGHAGAGGTAVDVHAKGVRRRAATAFSSARTPSRSALPAHAGPAARAGRGGTDAAADRAAVWCPLSPVRRVPTGPVGAVPDGLAEAATAAACFVMATPLQLGIGRRRPRAPSAGRTARQMPSLRHPVPERRHLVQIRGTRYRRSVRCTRVTSYMGQDNGWHLIKTGLNCAGHSVSVLRIHRRGHAAARCCDRVHASGVRRRARPAAVGSRCAAVTTRRCSRAGRVAGRASPGAPRAPAA